MVEVIRIGTENYKKLELMIGTIQHNGTVDGYVPKVARGQAIGLAIDEWLRSNKPLVDKFLKSQKKKEKTKKVK